MASKKISVYIDGAARGNPGPAGAGVAVIDAEGRKIKEFSRYLGETTNNIAEYHALLYGLQEALMLKADEVDIYVDSELVARQLNGEYRVRDENIKRLFDQALHMLSGIKRFQVHHIDRSRNKDADKLANRAINLAGK